MNNYLDTDNLRHSPPLGTGGLAQLRLQHVVDGDITTVSEEF